MNYSSEYLTRSTILNFSKKMKDETRRSLIINGSSSSSSDKAREMYFWFGSALFLTSGFALALIALFTVIFITFQYGPLGFFDFFLYAPGLILITIGQYLNIYEFHAKKGRKSILTKRKLYEASLLGLLITLFITIQ